jgi:glycosyltransferase involved in cell wall biosynthesis
VFPSWNEGLPNVVKEASASALPIVATKVGGIPEIVEDGATGFLVPARDVDALREAIKTLVRDAELRSRFGMEARRRVCRDYDYHKNGALLAERIRTAVAFAKGPVTGFDHA